MPRETATLERLKEIADILSAEFNVKPPQVVFSLRQVACYQTFFRTIRFPKRGSFRGVEFSMLHEFAHHLVEMTVSAKEKRRIRHHGPVFRDMLHKVAAAWYGDPERYAWGSEYKSIQEWHEKKKGGRHARANNNRDTKRNPGARSVGAPGVCCPSHASATGGAGAA